MTDGQGKVLIEQLLVQFTAGSVLHLLGDVLHARADVAAHERDQMRADRLREAEVALYVLGVGIDSVVGDDPTAD